MQSMQLGTVGIARRLCQGCVGAVLSFWVVMENVAKKSVSMSALATAQTVSSVLGLGYSCAVHYLKRCVKNTVSVDVRFETGRTFFD